MKKEELLSVVQYIVKQARDLKDRHTSEKDAPVNYCCIFTQSEKEYEEDLAIMQRIGNVVKETPSGLLFQIPPLETVAGPLRLVKIRLPDPTRPERGDADFTVERYQDFKKEYLSKKGFKLIPWEGFEMVELMDKEFDVRAYFSNPPLDKQLGIKRI